MASLLGKDNVNSGRQPELDIARGLAVLFMVAVHVLELFSDEAVVSSIYGTIVGFLGAPPAAPVFMFLLGTGIVYSKKNEAGSLLKRGCLIFLAGYLLNILRGSVPWLIYYSMIKDGAVLPEALNEFVYIDILQFAGLAFVYFAFLKKIRANALFIIISGVLFIFLNSVLVDLKTDNTAVSALSGLIWGSSGLSFFPFLSWIIYPIAGCLFGLILIRCVNKKKLYSVMLAMGLILFLVFCGIFIGLLNIDVGMVDEYKYYHHGLAGNLIYLSFILLWLSLLYWVSALFTGPVKSTIERWSRNVTPIYFIHWILLGNLTLFIDEYSCGIVPSIVIFLGAMILSDILSSVYSGRTRPRRQPA